MRRASVSAVLTIALLLIGTVRGVPAQPKRIALVVGNAQYVHVGGLRNPVNDATLIASTLTKLGFTLVNGGPMLNLDKQQFDDAIEKFSAELDSADVALFYYAGHGGLQLDGDNYLLPVDANPTSPTDARIQTENAQLLLSLMRDDKAKLNIVLLDACRNSPFLSISRGGSGLHLMSAPVGTVIAFATSPDEVASDGVGDHSPYAAALSASLGARGLSVSDMLNQAGRMVFDATEGAQLPWVSNTPLPLYYLAGPPAAPTPAPPGPPPGVSLVGGHGGGYSTLRCGAGETAVGLFGTVSAFLVQLGLVCADLDTNGPGPARFKPLSERGPVGQSYQQIEHWRLQCADDSILTGVKASAATYSGSILTGSVQLMCSKVSLNANNDATIDRAASQTTSIVRGALASSVMLPTDCASGAVVQLDIRSGAWVDAFGVECGAPSIVRLPSARSCGGYRSQCLQFA